jgi:hypothetical protein
MLKDQIAMQNFFILEGGYLILGFIIILVTLFVTTRPFMSRGAMKKGLTGVILILAFFIGAHYYVTANRMESVKSAFEKDQPIICESRMQRKAAQSIIIQKSNDWSLEGDNFVSPNYSRPFFSARCIVK